MSVKLSNYSMVTSGVNLSNQSSDVVAKSISVIDKDKVIDWKELLFSKVDALTDTVGLPEEPLNSLQQLAEAINSDANFFTNSMAAITLKSDLTYVNEQLDNILKKFLNYDTVDAPTIKFNLNSNITCVETSCRAIINGFNIVKHFSEQTYNYLIHQIN